MYGLFSVYLAYYVTNSYRIVNGRCIKGSVILEKGDQNAPLYLVNLSIYVLIPMLIVVILTGLIIYRLLGLIEKRRCQIRDIARVVQIGGRKRDSLIRTTRMLIGISLAFVLLEIPSAVSHLISAFKNENIFDTINQPMRVYKKIATIMEQLNHSINFVLYVLTCKIFRESVARLCRKKQQGLLS